MTTQRTCCIRELPEPAMRILASCLCGLVVLATASPIKALPIASRRSAPTAPARVTIDATEIGTLSPAALDEIATQATAEAAKHGIAPHELAISLVVIDHLEVIRGVRVSIVTPSLTLASPDGDPRGPLVARCQACAEDELKTVSIEGVLEALTQFEQARAATEAAAAAEAEPAVEPEPPPPSAPSSPDSDRPARRPLRLLGWTGVATLGLGVPALVTGLVFIGLGNDRPPARLPLAQDHIRDFAMPGYVLTGVGCALAISGAVMLGLDRQRSRGSTLAFAPHASPTTFGLRLWGAF